MNSPYYSDPRLLALLAIVSLILVGCGAYEVIKNFKKRNTKGGRKSLTDGLVAVAIGAILLNVVMQIYVNTR